MCPGKLMRVMALTIALCGLSLVAIGLGVALQLQVEVSTSPRTEHFADLVFLAPSVVGALLMFLGAIRIGLTARGHLLSFGLALIAGISLAMTAVRFSPNSSSRATRTLASLNILRIDGVVFSTALWRLLTKQGRI